MKYLRGRHTRQTIKVPESKNTMIDYLPVIFTIWLAYTIPRYALIQFIAPNIKATGQLITLKYTNWAVTDIVEIIAKY